MSYKASAGLAELQGGKIHGESLASTQKSRNVQEADRWRRMNVGGDGGGDGGGGGRDSREISHKSLSNKAKARVRRLVGKAGRNGWVVVSGGGVQLFLPSVITHSSPTTTYVHT